jgi:hypothetical protein
MYKFKCSVLLGIFLSILITAAQPVWSQQSTTGPVPPPDIDRGKSPVRGAPVIIPGVPKYLWHHGCGPTALGMVVGYWDGNGYPDLVPGDASTQTSAVEAMIADDSGNPNCSAPDGDHYQDFSCPIDYFPTLQPDRSETGGAHSSNCLGDFMRTSWSFIGNYYGWSWFSDVPGSFHGYVNWLGAGYTPLAINKYYSSIDFNYYKAEIDSGYPVVFLVDTDGDGYTDHFVTGVGYIETATKNSLYYGIYDTWDTGIHWYTWQGIASGNAWGIYGLTKFRLSGGLPDCGDVNDDGEINLADPICLANFYFGKPCPIHAWASDVNCEAGANLGDAIIIANFYFGKPGFELECCP